jgi:hypothetical protein
VAISFGNRLLLANDYIVMSGEISPLHKFALSFRLFGEQTAQASDNA